MSSFNFPEIGRLLVFLKPEKIFPQKVFYPAGSKQAGTVKESADIKKAASILSIHRTIAVKLEELAKGLDVSSRSGSLSRSEPQEKKAGTNNSPSPLFSKEGGSGRGRGIINSPSLLFSKEGGNSKASFATSPASEREQKWAGGKKEKPSLAEQKKALPPVPVKVFKITGRKETVSGAKSQESSEKPAVKQKQLKEGINNSSLPHNSPLDKVGKEGDKNKASFATTPATEGVRKEAEKQPAPENEKAFIPLGSQTLFPRGIKAKPFVNALQESAGKTKEPVRKEEAVQPKSAEKQSAVLLPEIAMKPIPSARMEIKSPPLQQLKFSLDDLQKQALVKADARVDAVQLKQPRAEIMAFFELMPPLKMESKKEKKIESAVSSYPEEKKEKSDAKEAITLSQPLLLSRKEKVTSKPSVQRVEVFAGRTEDFPGQGKTLKEASENAARFASYSVPGIEKTSRGREKIIKTREDFLLSKGKTVEETGNLKKEQEGSSAWKDREEAFQKTFSAEEPAAKSALKNTSEEIQKSAVRNFREDQLNISRMDSETLRFQQSAAKEAPRYAATAISEILKKSYRDDWSGDEIAAKLIALVMKTSSRYTYSHSMRVVDFSVALARELGIDDKESLDQIRDGALFRDIGKLEINLSAAMPQEREEINKTVSSLVAGGSFLHDIGKVKIPKEILLKEGKLTAEEQEILRQHPLIGEQIVLPIPALRHTAPAVRHHHEWWNAKGYPDGLSGEEIPLSARIVSIADAFDALISDRPYRKGMSVDSAKKLLKMEAGTHFDPELVEIFINMVEKNYHNVPVEVEVWS